MRTYTYGSAREHLAKVLDEANNGEIIEITRHGLEAAVVIGKSEFDVLTPNALPESFRSEVLAEAKPV